MENDHTYPDHFITLEQFRIARLDQLNTIVREMGESMQRNGKTRFDPEALSAVFGDRANQ